MVIRKGGEPRGNPSVVSQPTPPLPRSKREWVCVARVTLRKAGSKNNRDGNFPETLAFLEWGPFQEEFT